MKSNHGHLPSRLWGGAGGGRQARGAWKYLCRDPHQGLPRQPPHKGEAGRLSAGQNMQRSFRAHGARVRIAFVAVLTILAVTPAFAAELTDTPAPADHIRGLVVPLYHARLSSRLQATIMRIGPETGEAFKAGDVLVQFDCTAFEADREKARAEAQAAAASLAVKRELSNSGNASKLQAVLAEAELKKSRAAVDMADKQVADCEIKAPYDGRVVERVANAHETVGYRDPLIDIVGVDALELRVFVPSRALRSIDNGSGLELTVDETGERLPAQVIALGARIDNVSQLIELRAKFLGDTRRLISGMSGNVRFLTGLAVAGPATTGSIAP